MKLSLLAVGLLLALANSANAQDEVVEEEGGPFTATATFVSDYRFRGITQTQTDPALQLGLTYATDSGFYAGFWGSNVDFPADDGASLEVDGYIGWAYDINDDFAADVQLIRYFYPKSDVDLEYTELIGKVSAFGFTGLIGYSNDVFASGENGIYYSGGYSVVLAEEYTLAANIGYYDLDDAYGANITDYNIGVTRSFGPLTAGIAYVDTNDKIEEVFGGLSSGRFVFSLGATFNF